MLRFRVTVRNGKDVSIPVFKNAEALFVWLDDQQELKDARLVTLSPADFIDVEWLGCEVINWDKKYEYLDLVNISYARMPDNGSNHVVEHLHGWTTSALLPRITTESLTIRALNNDEGFRAPYPFE